MRFASTSANDDNDIRGQMQVEDDQRPSALSFGAISPNNNLYHRSPKHTHITNGDGTKNDITQFYQIFRKLGRWVQGILWTCMHAWVDGWMGGRKGGWIDRYIEGRWMDGLLDGWMDW